MGLSLNVVIEILDDWLKSQLKNTVNYRDGKDDIIHINRSVLELEHWLLEWRKKHQLNERLDASIKSGNILRNINQENSDQAFQSKDYQFNFLHFLARHYYDQLDLFELIDLFVEKFKDQFTFADIIVTKTGATRCKTNIRFALMLLRNMGMVLSRDTEGNRSWSPSIPGLVALLNIQYHIQIHGLTLDGQDTSFIEKKEGRLKPFKVINRYLGWPYDGTLYHSLHMFNDVTYLPRFLEWLKNIQPTKEEEDYLSNTIKMYLNFAQSAVEVSQDELRLTEECKKRAKIFQKDLFDNQSKNLPFMHKLLKYFQSFEIIK